jgi:hypothetical protein
METTQINELVIKAENGLVSGYYTQLAPSEILTVDSELAGYESRTLGKIQYMDKLQAQFHILRKPEFKSDAQTTRAWTLTPQGQEQVELETLSKRLKIVRTAIIRLYYDRRAEFQNIVYSEAK